MSFSSDLSITVLLLPLMSITATAFIAVDRKPIGFVTADLVSRANHLDTRHRHSPLSPADRFIIVTHVSLRLNINLYAFDVYALMCTCTLRSTCIMRNVKPTFPRYNLCLSNNTCNRTMESAKLIRAALSNLIYFSVNR